MIGSLCRKLFVGGIHQAQGFQTAYFFLIFHQSDKCAVSAVHTEGLFGGNVFGKLGALAMFEHGNGVVVQLKFGEMLHQNIARQQQGIAFGFI